MKKDTGAEYLTFGIAMPSNSQQFTTGTENPDRLIR